MTGKCVECGQDAVNYGLCRACAVELGYLSEESEDETDLPPLTPPRPNAGQHIDWDRPVGYSHAAAILAILQKTEESQKFTN